MSQEVGRVGIHAVCARGHELLAAVTSGQESDPEGAGALGGEKVPDAVADHEAITWRHTQSFRRREEQVGVGLGVGHLVARDDRRPVRYAEQAQWTLGGLLAAAGGY